MTLAERELLELLAEAVQTLSPAYTKRIQRALHKLSFDRELEELLQACDDDRILKHG